MSQDNLQEASIKTLDGLKDKHSKLTPSVIEELKNFLKQKYGIEKELVLNISQKELDALKVELDSNIDPKLTLEKFLYDEYIETKLENDGLQSASLDTVTSGIDSSRLTEMKAKFEEAIDPILNSYEFLNEGSKNIVKLALANKFINSSGGSNVMSIIGDLKGGLENMNIDSLTNMADNAGKQEKGEKSIESQFKNILTPYMEGFNTINKKLDEVTPKLTKEQKQNIINTSAYFRNPSAIETGWDEKVLAQIDVNNKDKAEVPLSQEEQTNIKDYLIKSRNKIEAVASQFEGGEKVLKLGLDMMAKDGIIGDTTKSIVEFLLKIPILGQILAMFLGLNGNDPIGDLNEQVENYKLLNSFKKFGIQKDETGKVTKKGEGIFKDIDVSGIEYAKVKPELKEIQKIKGSSSNDEFWEQAYSQNGFDVNGVKLKFEFTDEMKKDSKIATKEFKEIIKNGIERFHTEQELIESTKQEQERKDKSQKQKEQVQTIQTELASYDGKIGNIDDILNQKYEKITNFTTIIGPAISDVEISKIVNNSGDSFEAIIKDTIGDLRYTALLEKDLATLNNLFAFIKEFAKEKKIETGNVKDFLKTNKNEFHAFLTGKKTALVAEKTGKENEAVVIKGNQEKNNFATTIGNTIEKLQDGISLGNGIDIGDKKLSFNKNDQQLIIGSDKYSIKLNNNGTDYRLKDIKMTNGKVEFVPDIANYELVAGRALNPNLGFVNKDVVINGIKTLIIEDKYEYKKEKTNLTFTKMA